jgi:hypothetical protein
MCQSATLTHQRIRTFVCSLYDCLNINVSGCVYRRFMLVNSRASPSFSKVGRGRVNEFGKKDSCRILCIAQVVNMLQ